MGLARPDPITAATFLKYLSSLLATIGLFMALASFRPRLRPSAILIACFIWIACSLDAPYAQSTSLSLFAFAVVLLGFDFLLLEISTKAKWFFVPLAVGAALMRPEYFLPLAVVAGVKLWEARRRLKRPVPIVAAIVLAGAFVFASPQGRAFARRLNEYALFGLSQCYADYYARTHPGEQFSPMAEYKPLIDRTFGHPAGFLQAVENNPGEAARYFLNNGVANLRAIPRVLVGDYREQARHTHKTFRRVVYAILLGGSILGLRRLWRKGLRLEAAVWEKAALLFILAMTSVVSIVLLVPTPRYYLPCVPIFYLGLAFCVESLFAALNRPAIEQWVALGFGLWFCAPNYLEPRPNQEFEAVREAADFVENDPVVAGWWTKPDVVFALEGSGRALDLRTGLSAADIAQGRVDILLIDNNFRATKLWADNRDFFTGLTQHPGLYGFSKLRSGVKKLEILCRQKKEGQPESKSAPAASRLSEAPFLTWPKGL